jgi:hypothetical protein
VDVGRVPPSNLSFHIGQQRRETSLKRGKTYLVPIYLPNAQSGVAYLDGVSHSRRVGGAG